MPRTENQGHRTGSVPLADQGQRGCGQSNNRPPACSEYWSVHWLPVSPRPRSDVEAIRGWGMLMLLTMMMSAIMTSTTMMMMMMMIGYKLESGLWSVRVSEDDSSVSLTPVPRSKTICFLMKHWALLRSLLVANSTYQTDV